jgi:hypothetical protein
MRNFLISAEFLLATLTSFSQTFTPEKFGARIDDGKDDAPAFQRMFDAIPNNSRRVVIELQPGTYSIASTVTYPKYNDRTTFIYGKGAVLHAVGSDYDILTPGKYWNGTDLKSIHGVTVEDALFANDRIVIEDVRFENGRTQLRIVSSYLSVISRCQFVGGYRGFDGVFALQTSIENCWFNSFIYEGILLRSGQGDPMTEEDKYFSDATGSNSQSNISTISNCRIFANKPGRIGIRAYASSNLTVENTVIEGAAYKYAVHLDGRRSTTVVGATLRNIHLEFVGDETITEALIYARAMGTIFAEGIYSQFGRCIQLHANACRRIYVREWPYYPGGGFKAEGGGYWFFDNNWNMSEDDYLDSAFWNGGEIPWYVCHRQNEPNWRIDHGYANGLYGGEYGIADGKVDHQVDSYINTNKSEFKNPKDLSEYEVVQWIPFTMKDQEGNMVTNYIPILGKK